MDIIDNNDNYLANEQEQFIDLTIDDKEEEELIDDGDSISSMTTLCFSPPNDQYIDEMDEEIEYFTTRWSPPPPPPPSPSPPPQS